MGGALSHPPPRAEPGEFSPEVRVILEARGLTVFCWRSGEARSKLEPLVK